MGRVPVDLWIDWDDAIGVNRIMAVMVVTDDMIHIHRLGDALILIELSKRRRVGNKRQSTSVSLSPMT